MVKLPISESVLKYYEETGYMFSWKEQAHFCYRGTPGLLKRIDCLKEILEKSDDEELNKDIRMMIDYESGVYAKFMQNENNQYIYIIEIEDKYSGRKYHRIFRSIEKAMIYADQDMLGDYKISKELVIDDYEIELNLFPAKFEYNADREIIDYSSSEYEDDYNPDEHEPFECRFDNIFMKIDCPFERGDIVMSPEHTHPLIVLADRDVFHKKYEAAKSQYGDRVKFMLDYEDNRIPVLDCYNSFPHSRHSKSFIYNKDYHNDLSVVYRRPFLMEKIEHNEHYSEGFWNTLLYASEMVKCRYDMDAIGSSICRMIMAE